MTTLTLLALFSHFSRQMGQIYFCFSFFSKKIRLHISGRLSPVNLVLSKMFLCINHTMVFPPFLTFCMLGKNFRRRRQFAQYVKSYFWEEKKSYFSQKKKKLILIVSLKIGFDISCILFANKKPMSWRK